MFPLRKANKLFDRKDGIVFRMLIAITGHRTGIGQALYNLYKEHGHTVIGLSRHNGFDINDSDKIVNAVSKCDMFINNAYDGFAQVDLLYQVYQAWTNQPSKRIIVMSSLISSFPIDPSMSIEGDQYRTHKLALDEASRQLRYQGTGPKITLVKPGAVATKANEAGADTNTWALGLFNCLQVIGPELEIEEITLGPANFNITSYKD